MLMSMHISSAWMEVQLYLPSLEGFAVFFSLSRLAYLLQLKMRTQVTPNMKRSLNTIFLMDSSYYNNIQLSKNYRLPNHSYPFCDYSDLNTLITKVFESMYTVCIVYNNTVF